jgi:ABC-2 type transport system permease protein
MSVQSPEYIAFSPRRVGAIVLRHWYVIKSSWPRIFDLMYWPMVQMLMWGFLQLYVAQHSNFFAQAAGTFVAAVILWDILFRGQLGFSISFLEELYSRNMGNLMMSPLRPGEYVVALMTMSIIRLAIGTIPVTLVAIAFFGFNLWAMGLALAVFVFNLFLTGWSVALVVAGLLLRNGLGAENLAWGIMFLFLPLTCVYYPVSVLPDWLQIFAWMLPPTYVFEGMRALLIDKVFRADLMIQALALNAVVFAGSTIAAKFVGQNWKDSLTIGALMNTRGLMELVVLNIGYDLGVLTPEVFAMMVIMALLTTFMTGPALDLIDWAFKGTTQLIPQAVREISKYKILISFAWMITISLQPTMGVA